MSPAELFCATGAALFGAAWKSELARALGFHEKQIRRWAAGDYAPPPSVWAELAKMARERREALEALAGPVALASQPAKEV